MLWSSGWDHGDGLAEFQTRGPGTRLKVSLARPGNDRPPRVKKKRLMKSDRLAAHILGRFHYTHGKWPS